MQVLVVNAGSSSLKLRLVGESDELVESADLPATGDLASAIASWPRPDAVGHRIVHGGDDYTHAVVIDRAVERRLHELTDLAPLHQPKSLAGLDAVNAVLPDVLAVACFDTAFHRTMGAGASTYAVPAEWRARYAVRRYGFHGLSHAYASHRAAELAGVPVRGTRMVTCHLGAGASLCAVLNGRSVDTTMGFTPLEGLVMATRSGSVDPGLVLWLAEHENVSPPEIATALEHRSGLLALAGTPDMREVEVRASSGDPDATLALEVYTHRLVGSIAAMAAAAGGLDLVAFTGGVGENSALVRATVAERLSWLGLSLDSAANETVDGDADITGEGAAVRCVVVAAREDLQIAHEVRELLSGPREVL